MKRAWTAALLLALAAVPAGASHVESLYRIPPRRASETAGGQSWSLAISADGRYTVIASEAANLVPGMAADPLGIYLFLYDRVAGTTTRISRRSVESPDSNFRLASLSADGRFVAFTSRATDEIEGETDTNPGPDVFLWDRVTGETELVSRSAADSSRTGDNLSFEPVVSADGHFVAFTSWATDLVAGVSVPGSATSHTTDVFLWDRQTGGIEPVSRSAGASNRYANNSSLSPSISADGRFVAFLSRASNLVPGQIERGSGNSSQGTTDAFLWDRTTRQTVLVSRAAGNPLTTANRSSQEVLVSANGRFVALNSLATDLLHGGPRPGGPWPGEPNVFLWNRETGEMSLASHSPSGAPARGLSLDLTAVSADGGYVLFTSGSSNLLPNPDGEQGASNVFLWSRTSGRTTLVSRSTARGRGGDASSIATGLSADGTWIVFESLATDLEGAADPEPGSDVFLANSRSGRITLLSVPGESNPPETIRTSAWARISADGQWIAFATNAFDFVEGVRDLNRIQDVVLTSRQGNRAVATVHPPGLASATPQGFSFAPSVDASGRFVVFISPADVSQLVPGVQETEASRFGFKVFLYDRELRTLTLVTRSGTDPRFPSGGSAFEARISADGRWVTFTSNARDLLPDVLSGTGQDNVFLWDRVTGQTILVSRAAGSTATGGDHFSKDPRISADGSVIVFQSLASDLVAGQIDSVGSADIFLFDRTTGTVSLVSRTAGSTTAAADQSSFLTNVSADGRIVAFTSTANASDLVPGVTDTSLYYEFKAFLFDQATGTMTLASQTTAPAPTAGTGLGLALSADGRFLVLASSAADLVPGQTDHSLNNDLFLFDRIAGTMTLVTHVAGAPLTAASVGTGEADISADGRFVTFTSTAPNLVPGQVDAEIEGGSNDVFVFDRETGALEMITRAAGTVATGGPGESVTPRISADGRRVAFLSKRRDLVPGLHGPAAYNLYVHDRPSGATTLVTHVLGDPLQVSAETARDIYQGAGPFLSANGTVVTFASTAASLVPRDFNRGPDAFAATVP